MSKKGIVLLGATGSIGENCLRVIRANSGHLKLVGIAGGSRAEPLATIAGEFGLRNVALFDEETCARARQSGLFQRDVKLWPGIEGLNRLATLPEADMVVVAVVGTMGLHPTLAAIEAGKEIALASKEVLVLAGKFVMAAAKAKGVGVLPVDSEHNAVFQCLNGAPGHEVERIILTASGGPFRNFSLEEMAAITPEAALKHPNWSMGAKITVDSSTMANKGLELIEARWLFGMEPEQIKVVVHPQSIVHSMVEYVDGSILAQLSPPSMTFAIQHVLLYPERKPGVEQTLNFKETMNLEFHPPDLKKFACLRLAREAMEAAGAAPAIFNAANEVAVEAFLGKQISYLGIGELIDRTLRKVENFEPASLPEVLEADHAARRMSRDLIKIHEF